MRKEIVGRRISLKYLEPAADVAEALFALVMRNRTHLLPWLDFAAEYESVADAFAFLEGSERKWAAGTDYDYAIMQDGVHVGSIGAHFGSHFVGWKAEIVYWLSEEHCGHGYVSEAVGLLENELFGMGVMKLVITNDTLNIPSVNVARRCGYALEAVLRKDRWNKNDNRPADVNYWVKFNPDVIRPYEGGRD